MKISTFDGDPVEWSLGFFTKDHYPQGYCRCEISHDERCHIHGPEPCLGCRYHLNGKGLAVALPPRHPVQPASLLMGRERKA